jgi:3-isopropylmalate dehydrogenase
MLLRYSLGEGAAADAIETAVAVAIDEGFRTGDIATGAGSEKPVGTREMADAIIDRL